jgi:hypothetical protein
MAFQFFKWGEGCLGQSAACPRPNTRSRLRLAAQTQAPNVSCDVSQNEILKGPEAGSKAADLRNTAISRRGGRTGPEKDGESGETFCRPMPELIASPAAGNGSQPGGSSVGSSVFRSKNCLRSPNVRRGSLPFFIDSVSGTGGFGFGLGIYGPAERVFP